MATVIIKKQLKFQGRKSKIPVRKFSYKAMNNVSCQVSHACALDYY